ncbi:MAG TPA: hypothetical protein VGH13_04365 [Xanthobacteraceae bacterium]|jgi:hypothetical protein
MDLFAKCVDGLIALMSSDAREFDQRVDILVDGYLAGFGDQTALMRMKLEKAFADKAPATKARDLIRARIMRCDLDKSGGSFVGNG